MHLLANAQIVDSHARSDHRGWLTGHSVPNYLGVSPRVASCTDFVVADLSIVDLVDRPHAAGGFVICLANTRWLGPSGCNGDQYPDRVSKGLCWTMIWLTRIFTPHSRLFFGWRMVLAGSFAFNVRSICQLKLQP